MNYKNRITLGLIFSGIILLFFGFKSSQEPYRTLPNTDFQKGETLTYTAGYSFVDAGEAVVHLDENLHKVNDRMCYKVTVDAKTIGVFGWTTKVHDIWESYFDPKAIMPMRFHRDISENRYRLVETTDFFHDEKKAIVSSYKKDSTKVKVKEYPIHKYCQDIISGYYLLRTLEYESMSKGDTIKMKAFFEDKEYDFNMLYVGKDRIRTKFGQVDAFAISPIMPPNSMFSGENAILFWVSDDANRVPLKVSAKLLIGAINLRLVDYKGLKEKIGKKK
ncbi:DUF3108 domain-containing protein [Algivirga pacifica]|uniref:DUF3108 domain-containing protein n=1 Tax=Algivirga pacifica TaxID=1162670 RepID=A0ABP9DCB0_9BACT